MDPRSRELGEQLIEASGVDADYAAGAREPVEVLVDSILHTTGLRPEAIDAGIERIRDDLAKVATLQADRRRFPELTRVEVSRPVFILGMPRCGTSILQALMGADPAARMIRQWEMVHFSPPPEPLPDDDPRVTELDTALRGEGTEEIRKMHPLGAVQPQECGPLLESSFRSTMFCMDLSVPEYLEWYLECDSRPAYELHRQWLQQFQLRNSADWWILKIQEHMYHVPELLSVYPDAMLVQPHRDPTTVMASISSLISVLRRRTFTSVDPVALGTEMLHLWGSGLEKFMAFRDRHPEVKVCDVAYRDIVRDPVGTVQDIYEFFGLPFDVRSETAVKEWWAMNPPNKDGTHRYSLEDWGLTPERVEATYGAYRERYGVFF